MLRKIFLIILITVIVISIILACALLGANELLARYKPYLESKLSEMLGTEVRYETAKVSPLQGFRIVITDMKLGGNEKSKPQVTAKSISTALKKEELVNFKVEPDYLSIQDLSVLSPKIKASKVEFEFEKLGLNDKEKKYLAGKLSAYDLHVVDGIDKYKFDSILGPISYETSKSSQIFSARADIKNFGYSNGETTIDKVNASLRDVKGNINGAGDTNVNLQLDAKSIELKDPSITIKRADRVTAPIAVKIPAKGGYEVSGPVKITNSSLNTAGKDFDSVSSVIQMLVSRPSKDFRADKISFKLYNSNFSLKTHFTMKHDEYLIRETSLSSEKGTLNTSITLSRKEPKPFTGQIDITEMDLANVLYAVIGKQRDDYGGVIKSFKAKFSGRISDFIHSQKTIGDFHLIALKVNNKDLGESILTAAEEVPDGKPIDLPSDEIVGKTELTGEFQIENQKAYLKNLKMPLKRMNVQAEGAIGFDKRVDVKIEAVFLKETFEKLGLGIKPLKSLFGGLGKVSIPLVAEGFLPDVEVKSNRKEWLKRFSGVSILEKVVGTVSDVGKSIVGKDNN